MNNLIFNCSENLPQPSIDCAVDYGNAVKLVLTRTPILTTGNVPSASEIANTYNAGEAAVLSGFTNFKRVQKGSTEIDDPETGNLIHYDNEYTISGRIKRMDNAVLRLTEILTRYLVLYLYYLTDRNYCFGPYKSEPFFSLIKKNVTPVYVDFKFDFFDIGIDYKNQDDDYEDIPGLTSYLLKEDGDYLLTETGGRIIL